MKTNRFKWVFFALFLLCSFVAAAQETESNLVVHGFLTQAYAASNGNTIFGIPDEGTTDFRNAALQFRYSLTKKNQIVMQLGHERFGVNQLNDFQSDVKLDWAFIQHSFNDATWIKVGRVQIPIGIYNEIRDVGTILPFYRPSPNVYGDRSFTSETVDGVVGFHRFFQDSSWSVELSPHYGYWEIINNFNPNDVFLDRVENAFGAQVWVNTPLNGLRFGIHRGKQTIRDGLASSEPGKVGSAHASYLSLDGSFEKFLIRSEYRYVTFPFGHLKAFYVQAGYSITEKISIAAQYDTSRARVDQRPFFLADEELDRDLGISFRYHHLPNLVTRFETHWNRGKNSSDPVALLGIDKPLHTFYFILSVSASF